MDPKDKQTPYFENWSDEQKWQFLSRHEPLGEILVKNGLLTVEQLEKLLGTQKQSGKHIGQMIIDAGYLDINSILAALEQQFLSDKVSLQSIADLKNKNKKNQGE